MEQGVGAMKGGADTARCLALEKAVAEFPDTPIPDEWLGAAMLYSSGTTGRPKGILRPLPEKSPSETLPLFQFVSERWQYRDGMTYLSPAPLYHSAPQAAVSLAIDIGATVIIMEHFDPEQYLSLIERHQVTHTQLVPTMFSRLLRTTISPVIPRNPGGSPLGSANP
jgi:long-chain acyl-CoA synthetase